MTIQNDSHLLQLTELDRMLAVATRIDDITEIRAKIEALRVYAVNISESKQNCKLFAMARLRAERKAGQVMLLLPKRNGARPADTGFIDAIPYEIEGVKPSQRNSWQTIAKLPDDLFEDLMLGCIQNDDQEITTSFFYKAGRIHMNKHNTQAYQRQQSEAVEVDEALFRFAFVSGIFYADGVFINYNEEDVVNAMQRAIEAWKAQQAEGE